ncbi:HIT domain-containing protein [Catenaria anguillulae PL171]|uniref:HIT domain-containing protein n=1 Tax=Catenaria anguillulae PL171 TaxID=765915 RepID=A0A1Y2HM88_9FUNG|nr:HIT domain-containing protein [Catenaria anguillulae PL171]
MPPQCVFCNINQEEFRLEYLDNEIAVFHDISPSAQFHFQAIPLEHIPNIKSLNSSHIPLLRRLESTARQVLARDSYVALLGPNPQIRFGFHVPPFNSVHHLHLHVLVGPIKTSRKYKYYVSWFATLEDVIRQLEEKPGA